MRRRRGQALVLMIVFLLIALIGVLALTLDFGFVLLARRQMQTGVNTTALEGARDVDTNQDGQGDGRQNASTLLRNNYDDDFDLTGNTTTVGAGIDGSLVQGNGYQNTRLGDGTNARDLYRRRSQFVYRPIPQLNAANEIHGDFVRGEYEVNDDPSLALKHAEFSDYTRDDFSATEDGDAFLVRLRRTHDPLGIDNIAGVSSAGSGMPLLIGRLGWMADVPNDAEFSIRRDGVTVRATAIADKRIAVRVWTYDGDQEILGAIPFWIRQTDFVATSDPAAETRRTPAGERLTHVGMEANFGDSTLPKTPVDQPGYVAVVDDALQPPRVVGFWLAPDPDATDQIPNASPRLQDAWEVWGQLTDAERNAVLASQKEIADNATSPLLKTPLLVRSIR